MSNKFNQNITEAKVFERIDDNLQYEYSMFKTPMFVNNRDALNLAYRIMLKNGDMLAVSFSVEHSEWPNKWMTTRISADALYHITTQGTLNFYLKSDLGGWISNMFVEKQNKAEVEQILKMKQFIASL